MMHSYVEYSADFTYKETSGCLPALWLPEKGPARRDDNRDDDVVERWKKRILPTKGKELLPNAKNGNHRREISLAHQRCVVLARCLESFLFTR